MIKNEDFKFQERMWWKSVLLVSDKEPLDHAERQDQG